MGSVDSQQSEANDLHVTMVKIILAARKKGPSCVDASLKQKKRKMISSTIHILQQIMMLEATVFFYKIVLLCSKEVTL